MNISMFSFFPLVRIFVLFICLQSKSIFATDNFFRYLEQKNFTIDRLETYNLYKTLRTGMHDTLGSYQESESLNFKIEFHTIMYMVRDEYQNLYLAILQNQAVSLFGFWMQNLAESVGIHTIPTYPAFINFNQKENLDIVPKDILENIEDAISGSGKEDVPVYEPVLLVHAPDFFLGKDSPGYFEFFGDNLRGVFSPKQSPNMSPAVQKEIENAPFSRSRMVDALSFLLLEYLLSVEGESRVVMEDQFVGVTVNTFFRDAKLVDNRKFLAYKLRKYVDEFGKIQDLSSKDATIIYKQLLARARFFKEVIPKSLTSNLRVFSGLAISNANPAQVMSFARQIQKKIEERLLGLEQDLHFVFQNKMGKVFGNISFEEIEKVAALSGGIKYFTGEGEFFLSPNYQENVEKFSKLARRGFEKRILWDLYRAPEINSTSNHRYWESKIGLEPYSFLPTILEESRKYDSTNRVRGAISAHEYVDISRPVPQLVLPKDAPPSLLVLPMNDSEMDVIFKSAQEIAKYADLEILRLHGVERPFKISDADVKAIVKKYPGRRIILCEVKNARKKFVAEAFASVGSELVVLDHHNQNVSDWDWRSTSEQFWDLYAYRPDTEQIITAIIDRSGLKGLARNLNISDSIQLKDLLERIGNSKVTSERRKYPGYKIELDSTKLFYLIEDNNNIFRMRDIGDYLGLKHFPEYFQFVIYRGKHISYTGDPIVISHFIREMYPLAKKHNRPMFWYGDLNHELTVVYFFNSHDTVDKIVRLIRELNQKKVEGNLTLSTFNFSEKKPENGCDDTFK